MAIPIEDRSPGHAPRWRRDGRMDARRVGSGPLPEGAAQARGCPLTRWDAYFACGGDGGGGDCLPVSAPPAPRGVDRLFTNVALSLG